MTDLGSNLEPKTVYDIHAKDNRSLHYYGCSYEDYMLSIIYNLITDIHYGDYMLYIIYNMITDN